MGTPADSISPNGMDGLRIHHLGVCVLGVCGESPCRIQYLGICDTMVYRYPGVYHGTTWVLGPGMVLWSNPVEPVDTSSKVPLPRMVAVTH